MQGACACACAAEGRQARTPRACACAFPIPPFVRSLAVVCPVRLGYLLKQGGVVKNWKRRYFVLSQRARQLAYYKEKDEVRGQMPWREGGMGVMAYILRCISDACVYVCVHVYVCMCACNVYVPDYAHQDHRSGRRTHRT